MPGGSGRQPQNDRPSGHTRESGVPDPLPDGALEVLPEGFSADAIERVVRLSRSPEKSFGKTLLVNAGGQWMALYQDSLLEPWHPMPLHPERPFEEEVSGFDTHLAIRDDQGTRRLVRLSAMDRDRIADLPLSQPESNGGPEPDPRPGASPSDSVESSPPPSSSGDPTIRPEASRPPEESAPGAITFTEPAPIPSTPPSSAPPIDDSLPLPPGTSPPGTSGLPSWIPDRHHERIVELVESERLLQAIREIRQVTGCSLPEAKRAVDALTGERTALDDSEAAVLEVLREEGEATAVMYLREYKGISTADAVLAVRDLARKHGIAPRGNRQVVLVAVAAMLVLLVGLVVALLMPGAPPG